MSVMMELSMFPTDRGEGLSEYVARSLAIIEASGLAYKFGPMGTTIEAPTAGELFAVVEKCLAAMQTDCRRVAAAIKLDWRAGSEKRLGAKVASVVAKVGHELNT